MRCFKNLHRSTNLAITRRLNRQWLTSSVSMFGQFLYTHLIVLYPNHHGPGCSKFECSLLFDRGDNTSVDSLTHRSQLVTSPGP
eukprot:8777529-Pyramimonas_sp.AAC.2